MPKACNATLRCAPIGTEFKVHLQAIPVRKLVGILRRGKIISSLFTKTRSIAFALIIGFSGASFADTSARKMNWIQILVFNLFYPYDTSSLDIESFLPESLNFFKADKTYFGVDCAFATLIRSKDGIVPPDIKTRIAKPQIVQSNWKDGHPFRAFSYTPFVASPVSEEIATGMSQESATFGLGPQCSTDIPRSMVKALYNDAKAPDWLYAFGRKGEFMILVNVDMERGYLIFRD